MHLPGIWHVRGKGPNPMPMLLVHGWPGSIFEFHHLIGRLTDPAAHGGDPASQSCNVASGTAGDHR